MKVSWYFEGLHTPIWVGYARIVIDAGRITFNAVARWRLIRQNGFLTYPGSAPSSQHTVTSGCSHRNEAGNWDVISG